MKGILCATSGAKCRLIKYQGVSRNLVKNWLFGWL